MVNLTPWRRRDTNELSPLSDYRSDFDRFFDRLFESPLAGFEAAAPMIGWAPLMEIADEDDHLTITAEIPGMESDDIDISVSGNQLTISGEKKMQSERKREGFYRSERRYGSFRRTIELPSDVDADRISAEYESGVLKLEIPRTQGRGTKRIQVQSGGGRSHKVASTQPSQTSTGAPRQSSTRPGNRQGRTPGEGSVGG